MRRDRRGGRRGFRPPSICASGQNRAGAGAAPGLLAKAEQIDNYLGLPGLTGAAMLEAFAAHARSLGIEAEEGRVANLMPLGGRFLVNFGGDILDAGSLILACGVSKARPPVPGEAELLGRGVSYCATCDGMLYRGKPVVVWGLRRMPPTRPISGRHRLPRHLCRPRSARRS